jgi:hypothetical protein
MQQFEKEGEECRRRDFVKCHDTSLSAAGQHVVDKSCDGGSFSLHVFPADIEIANTRAMTISINPKRSSRRIES